MRRRIEVDHGRFLVFYVRAFTTEEEAWGSVWGQLVSGSRRNQKVFISTAEKVGNIAREKLKGWAPSRPCFRFGSE